MKWLKAAKIFLATCSSILVLSLAACSHSFLKYDKAESLTKNDEFAQVVKIERAADDSVVVEGNAVDSSRTGAVPESADKKQDSKKSKKASSKKGKTSQRQKTPATSAEKAQAKVVTSAKAPSTKARTRKKLAKKSAPPENAESDSSKDLPAEGLKASSGPVTAATASEASVSTSLTAREPDLEDSEGFASGSRRPLVDPFQRGEVVTHSVSYFGISAGELKLKVEPFAQVNGKKAYTFAIEIKSASVFASIYSADDRVETLVDYDLLIPRTFALHVKESGQLREAKSFFDADKNMATYWEKKVTKKSGEEEKKQQWEILPYTQNVFSALYYMRVFKWDLNKEYAYRVADDEKNLVFTGKAIRKEKISTDAGEFNAIVIKPEIKLKGAFTPMGDIYIWLSDDEHKYILRIESKIKIGTLVSEVTKITPGKP